MENTTGAIFVMHAAGFYQINYDGESGGYFVWNDCGLKVNFPSQCSRQPVQITANTFLPVKNEIYPGVHIVSAVYQFNCDIERFDKPFTLCLQHCVKLQSSEDCQKMRFIIMQDGSSDAKCGRFEAGESFGIVSLDRFCHIFIVWIRELWNKICLVVLPLSANQDNSSQQVASNHSYNKSIEAHVKELSTSQAAHTGSFQSTSGQQHGSSQALSSNSTVVDDNSPPYKYEAMISLPRDHHCLTNSWSGYYSIYYDYGTWRQVTM